MSTVSVKDWFWSVARRYAWAPLGVFTVHVVFSRVILAYDSMPWIDVPMHFVGGVTITWFALGAARAAVEHHLIGRPNRAGLLVLAFLAGSSATVYWEFAEFIADRYLFTAVQLGLEDTLLDMFLGVLGAATLVGVSYVRPARLEATSPAE